ncbi:MAG: hypothetical protein AAGC47_05620 [Bacteroidota bacterium]
MKLLSKLIGLSIVLGCILISCSSNDDEDDSLVDALCEPGETLCDCFGCIIIENEESCEENADNNCGDGKYYDFDLCSCVCLNGMCGTNCGSSPPTPCNFILTDDCDCIPPFVKGMIATIIFEERGDTVEFMTTLVEGNFFDNDFNIDSGDDDDYIYIEQSSVPLVEEGTSYPILPLVGFASVLIEETNGEIWTTVGVTEPGFVAIGELDRSNNTYQVSFEFPITNGTETAWVRNGTAFKTN